MNPMQPVEMTQLYGHSMHAGGWPKLGWQQADADASDEVSDDSTSGDDAPRVFS
jgi:hypothetical protein